MARERSWGDVGPNGFVVGLGGVILDSEKNVQISFHRCEDVVGNFTGVNPLRISHREFTKFKPLNGEQITTTRKFKDNIPDYYLSNAAAYNHLSVDLPPWGATELMKRTNPSRPEVMLPVSIVELRELPALVRHLGRQLRPNGRPRNVPRSLAEANLTWQFGWAPLIGDVNKLIQFSDITDSRVKELKKLTTSTGLRRRVKLGQGVTSQKTPSVTIQSVGTTYTAQVEKITSYLQWGTIRWKSDNLLGASDAKLKSLARRAVLGLGTDMSSIASNLWELIPWSWLIDYYANVGDYLQAHNNTVPSYPTGICVMTTMNTTTIFKPNSHSWLSGGDATISYITKDRDIRSAALAAGIPFLSGRQMSILGSLAVVRSKIARR